MNMSRLFVLALVAGPPLLTAAESVPAWTDEQIEQDWVIQAHMSPENLRALARQDAAAIIDGVKSGQPEQQTLLEQWAWWEVDLGAETALDRIEVFNPKPNRDRGVAFKVTVGSTREDFQQVHFMRGPEWTKGPLVVKLAGRTARWVRVWAGEWRDRMRLSEVEVYGVSDPAKNLALHARADQSSFELHPGFRLPGQDLKDGPPDSGSEGYPLIHVPVTETIARGRKLAAALAGKGVAVEQVLAGLAGVERRLSTSSPEIPVSGRLPLYIEARRIIRKMAFSNPLLRDCDSLLFVKRVPGWATSSPPQFNSEYVRPGGGIYLLEGLLGGEPRIRPLTADFPPGTFTGLELSHDAGRILFAYARHDPETSTIKSPVPKEPRAEESFFHLFEMDLKTGHTRQITHGKYDDFHGVYLPGGDIVFVSTRRASFIQLGLASARETLHRTVPDCFLRCGISQIHTLHRMRADGSMLRTLSPTDTHEWYPTVAHDGRILYARWDYVDRDARIAFGLWSSNPDGTQAAIVYGNYSREPYCIFEAQPIPGSRRLIFTGSAHHSNAGGPLMILDPNLGVDGQEPLTNLTPEVGMPEYKVFPLTFYQAPWPLSEEFYFCGWSARPLTISTSRNSSKPNDLGIYLYDAFGNRELIHRDPAINSSTPLPLRPRPVAPCRAELPLSTEEAPTGTFFLSSVYDGLTGIPRGTVKRLRIVAVPPRVRGTPIPAVRMQYYEAGKFVLGTVPVESDGSAHFVAPAGVPLWFQALGEDARAVQTMRSAVYLQGGERQSCAGCHESRNSAPPPGAATFMALRRPPSKIRCDVEGSWPLRFDRLVQPVLDRLVAAGDPKTAELDLTPARDWKEPEIGRGTAETYSWMRLAAYGGDRGLFSVARRQDVDAGFSPSVPGQCLASGAPLWDLLTAPKGLALTAEERARLACWMDTYIPFVGHFSPEQEAEIAARRERWGNLLEPIEVSVRGKGVEP